MKLCHETRISWMKVSELGDMGNEDLHDEQVNSELTYADPRALKTGELAGHGCLRPGLENEDPVQV